LLAPNAVERNGYLPNVGYSCGATRHRDSIVIAYGASDTAIGFATVAVPALLNRMRRTADRRRRVWMCSP